MIVKRGKNKWCLLSRKTKRNLGCYNSLAGVKNRERQVQYFKHQKSQVAHVPNLAYNSSGLPVTTGFIGEQE